MLKTKITTGATFTKFLQFLVAKSKEGFGWQLHRSDKRNLHLNIQGIIMSGKLTNASIGLALSKQVNVILTISPLSYRELTHSSDDIMDILYKNDLFVFSLGYNWIFQSIYGRKILTKILGGINSHQIVSGVNLPHIYIDLNPYSTLSSVLTRLHGVGLWIPPRYSSDFENIKIQNILIVDGKIDFNNFLLDEVGFLVTTRLHSDLVSYCWKKKIILAWIHKDQLLNEIARDFAFYIAQHILPIEITFSSMRYHHVLVKN